MIKKRINSLASAPSSYTLKISKSASSQDIKISVITLQKMLNDRGFYHEDGMGTRQVIVDSYQYWKAKDPVVHRIMTSSFME